MVLKRMILVVFLSFIYLFLTGDIQAATCSSVCKYANGNPLSSTSCRADWGDFTVTAAKDDANASKVKVSVNGAFFSLGDQEFSKLCVALDSGPDGVPLVDNCTVMDVNPDTGVGSISIDPKSGGAHRYSVYSDAALSNAAHCDTKSVTLDSTTLPTQTPTPIPSANCIDVLGARCLISTVAQDLYGDQLDTSRGTSIGVNPPLPICPQFHCSLSSDPSGAQGEGIVRAGEQNTDLNVDGAIDIASQGCGIGGISCCIPNTELPDTNIPYASDNNGFLGGLISKFKGLFDQPKKDAMSNFSQASGSSLCAQGYPSLQFNEGVAPPASLATTPQPDQPQTFLRNEFNVEPPGYIVEPYSVDDTGAVYPSPTIFIQQETVKACTCIDPNNETVGPKDIQGICKKLNDNNLNAYPKCQTCGDDEVFLADIVGKSPDNGYCEKIQNVINAIRTQNPKTPVNKDIAVVKSDSEGDVLGLAVAGGKDVKYCGLPGQAGFLACWQCTVLGMYWSGTQGCLGTGVDTSRIQSLCKNATTEKTECRVCASEGKLWTALGCIDLELTSFIQNQVFGWGIGLAGTVALLCIIYSSFIMQTSANNPERIKQAQDMLTSCITGLIVIIFSVFILNIIGVDILRIPEFERGARAPSAVAPTATPTPP